MQPFDRGAVARVIEHSARLAGDAERLSTHMRSVADLLREADYWAREAGREVVDAAARAAGDRHPDSPAGPAEDEAV